MHGITATSLGELGREPPLHKDNLISPLSVQIIAAGERLLRLHRRELFLVLGLLRSTQFHGTTCEQRSRDSVLEQLKLLLAQVD